VEFFREELCGGIWHTTSVERYHMIVGSGYILPEPEIPDSLRWKTRSGPEGYSYVRKKGGVSLFDFRGFDIEAYSSKYPLSSWGAFIPVQKDWHYAVWIEIEQELGSNFIAPASLVAAWKSDEAYRHTIMPYMEAAYIGPLSVRKFKRVLRVDKKCDVEELPCAAGDPLCPTLPSFP
jgi:hypothetical protein